MLILARQRGESIIIDGQFRVTVVAITSQTATIKIPGDEQPYELGLSESIPVLQDVEIQVSSISGGQVRLGITAPRHIGIVREELLEKPLDEREAEPNSTVRSAGTESPGSGSTRSASRPKLSLNRRRAI
ncbi:carbon storage regulator CsrA [Litorivivens lipolytica]|uniref:Translational regulator CsrA n=1 Tax=Litorivivens lipolytica TaxID=1524264 RepID=A0A7W4W7I6_9GAMM|nr:carbon storage regulator CsrA [Litorivivens lipolytica]